MEGAQDASALSAKQLKEEVGAAPLSADAAQL